MGKMVVTILVAVAEAERQRTMERTNEGRLEALSRGVRFGPKIKVNRKKLIELKKAGKTAIEIASLLKISRSTVYKVQNEINKGSQL